MTQLIKAESIPLILNQSINDFDEFLETVREWDLEFHKMDKSSFRAELHQIINGPLHFVHTNFNSHLEQHGQPPPKLRTIGIPADGNQNFILRGQEINGNEICIWPLGSELEAISKAGFHVFVLSLPEDYLTEVGNMLELPRLDEMSQGKEKVMVPIGVMNSLRSTLLQFCQMNFNDDCKGSLVPTMQNDVFDLTRTLLLAIANSFAEGKRPRSRLRDQALKRAKEYIAEYAHNAPTIPDICAAAFASERTLQYAFIEHYGISPKHYLETFRLNAVRKELHLADPSMMTVKAVAEQWGFWHMGKLGKDYYNLFGELPSETLNKKKQKIF